MTNTLSGRRFRPRCGQIVTIDTLSGLLPVEGEDRFSVRLADENLGFKFSRRQIAVGYERAGARWRADYLGRVGEADRFYSRVTTMSGSSKMIYISGQTASTVIDLMAVTYGYPMRNRRAALS